MKQSVTLILEGERPISWNDFYSGKHWSVRKAEADRVHWLVRSAIDPDSAAFQQPVAITVTGYFDKRPLDASNIAAKLYEDALKGWLIADDSWRHVYSVTTQTALDRTRPRVEIQIEEV